MVTEELRGQAQIHEGRAAAQNRFAARGVGDLEGRVAVADEVEAAPTDFKKLGLGIAL